MQRSILTSDQSCETQLQRYSLGDTLLRYVYARSAESQSYHQLGQDYFKVAWGESSSHQPKIVFALCDGVGSSFMGHLGAQLVGDDLCEKLWSRALNPSPPKTSAQLIQRLTLYLIQFRSISQETIQNHALPSNLPVLTRRALDNQREYGSEAMFVCGMLLNQGWFFAWLGDARLQVLDEQFAPVNGFIQQPDTRCRWSSKVGPRGDIQSMIFRGDDVKRIKHILAFSDGLASIETPLAQLSDETISTSIASLETSPASDDISLLHFILSNR
ncbi:MAG: protein phosphatase 2C domain-containing protein [Chloroflexota bacterium]